MPQAWYNAKSTGENEATIVIEGDIGLNWMAETWDEFFENTKERFRKKVAALANEGVTRIYVDINSFGGSLHDGISIHDLLAGFNGEVITTTYGMSASAATIAHQSASKGKRRVSANSLYLIHKSLVWPGWSNANDLEAHLEDNRNIDEMILNIYKGNTPKKNHKALEELMNSNGGHGKWITAQQAVEYGLADEVYEPKVHKAMNVSKYVNMVSDLRLPEVPRDMLNMIEPSGEDGLMQRFLNMSWINDFVNKLKEQGLKIVDSEGQDVPELENKLGEDNIKDITNSVVSDAIGPVNDKLEEIRNSVITEEFVTNAITEALKPFENNEDFKNLSESLENLEEKVKNLSSDESEKKVTNGKMPKVKNGKELKIEEADQAGGFQIEVEV